MGNDAVVAYSSRSRFKIQAWSRFKPWKIILPNSPSLSSLKWKRKRKLKKTSKSASVNFYYYFFFFLFYTYGGCSKINARNWHWQTGFTSCCFGGTSGTSSTGPQSYRERGRMPNARRKDIINWCWIPACGSSSLYTDLPLLHMVLPANINSDTILNIDHSCMQDISPTMNTATTDYHNYCIIISNLTWAVSADSRQRNLKWTSAQGLC